MGGGGGPLRFEDSGRERRSIGEKREGASMGVIRIGSTYTG